MFVYSSRVQRPRIPELMASLNTSLKEKGGSYGNGREHFELPIGTVWMGMNKVLLVVLDSKVPIDRDVDNDFVNMTRVGFGKMWCRKACMAC